LNNYVLDACALIALLREETGADKVANVINAAFKSEAKVVMHKINLLEVYYDVYRLYGKSQANIILSELKKQPVIIKSEIDDNIFAEAGRMKASYKISLADSIALAETYVSNSSLLTSDHHEFDVIEKYEKIKFEWIR